MKNIFSFLLVVSLSFCGMLAQAQSRPLLDKHTAVRTQLKAVSSAEEFLSVVRKGDTAAILSVQDAALLQVTDKFGNNCFHLAKDALTLQSLGKVVRRLTAQQAFATINHLRNQRNNMGETPLMAHINYGKTDTFQLLYEGSELAGAIREARSVSMGGSLLPVAEIKQGVVLTLSKDNSGRTVAQAALANRDFPGMESIVQFFDKQAPYLF